MDDSFYEKKPLHPEELLKEHIEELTDWIAKGLTGDDYPLVKARSKKVIQKLYQIMREKESK